MKVWSPWKRKAREGNEPTPLSPAEDRFTAFYERNVHYVYKVLFRSGIRRDEEIADLAQEVFLVAHRKWSTYDPARASERAWLHGIAFNEARHFRRRDREDPMEIDEAIHESTDPELLAADAERFQKLLNSTTPERRRVFELYEIDGFTIPEIARSLGIPATTATKRLKLARRDIEEARNRMRHQDQHRSHGSVLYGLPFGVGAWHDIDRSFMKMPPGFEAQLWQRIRARLDDADPTKPPTPARTTPPSSRHGLSRALGSHLGSALVGGVIGAALMHAANPAFRIASEMDPSATSGSALLTPSAPTWLAYTLSSSSTDPSTRADAGADPGMAFGASSPRQQEEELLLLRKAQAAYGAGNNEAAREALALYDQRFKNGRFRSQWVHLQALVVQDGGF